MRQSTAQSVDRNALDTAGAAEYCGLAQVTLSQYRQRGGGPAFCKLGRKVVYLKADLDAFLASRRVVR